MLLELSHFSTKDHTADCLTKGLSSKDDMIRNCDKMCLVNIFPHLEEKRWCLFISVQLTQRYIYIYTLVTAGTRSVEKRHIRASIK